MEAPDAKRARVEKREEVGSEGAAGSGDAIVKEALSATKGVCGVELQIGARLEVRWVVSATDEEETKNKEEGNVPDNAGGGEAEAKEGEAGREAGEGKPEAVWWGCVLARLEELKGEHGPVWVLAYDGMTVKGESFKEEERRVSFTARNLLHDKDVAADASTDGAGVDHGLMQWRLAGANQDLAELFGRGDFVKVCRAGEEARQGQIVELNSDGTYHVAYGDDDEELSVQASAVSADHEMELAAAEMAAAEAEGDEEPICAEGIDDFIELNIQMMLANPKFEGLEASAKRAAMDKILELKEPMRMELLELLAEKGAGYTVGAADMSAIMPKVMRRVAESSK
uniref:Uncharacterized protein n=1 Tax=Hemiselmis andersenii TaxID=464988 RepID=A0A7S0U9K3_HEMAN|mmetsp:Transcript_40677/g.94389  ORF Transcript_40677/g.94389 Transcript_40677/m.94389 type:complete len:341 (+) Transcript_40677:56-1078(+)